MKIIHISFAGPERVIVDAKGRRWKFEMHPQCGPIVIGVNGDPLNAQPGPKSPIWHAVTRWAQDGHRLDDKGVCVWEEEPQPILEHIVGKHYRVLGWTGGKL